MLMISRNLDLVEGEEFNGKEAPPPGNNSKPTFLQRFTVYKLSAFKISFSSKS